MTRVLSFAVSMLIGALIGYIVAINFLPTPIAGVPVETIDDSGVPQTVTDVITDPAGYPYVDVSSPDYPSGRLLIFRVEAPDLPRNPAADAIALKDMFGSCGIDMYWLYNSIFKFKPGSYGLIPDWVMLGQDLADYGDPESGPEMKRDVLALANVHWPTIDVNNDHVISRSEAQLIFLIPNHPAWASVRYPGIGTVTTLNHGEYDFGQRPVLNWSIRPPTDPAALTDPLRTNESMHGMVHELSHALFGLLDRYRGPSGTGFGGQYDIMTADRSWEYLPAYDRVKLGFIDPYILTPPLNKAYSFRPSELFPDVVALVDPARPSEYWLIEYRRPTGWACPFDSNIPEIGFAIWWVREGAFNNTSYNSEWRNVADFRLVHAGQPDGDPDGTDTTPDGNGVPIVGSTPGYYNPQSGALFTETNALSNRQLFYSNGTASPFSIRVISIDGAASTLWITTN